MQEEYIQFVQAPTKLSLHPTVLFGLPRPRQVWKESFFSRDEKQAPLQSARKHGKDIKSKLMRRSRDYETREREIELGTPLLDKAQREELVDGDDGGGESSGSAEDVADDETTNAGDPSSNLEARSGHDDRIEGHVAQVGGLDNIPIIADYDPASMVSDDPGQEDEKGVVRERTMLGKIFKFKPPLESSRPDKPPASSPSAATAPAPPPRAPRLLAPMELFFDMIYVGVESRLNIVYQDSMTGIGTMRYLGLSYLFIWYWWICLWYTNTFYYESLHNRVWSFLSLLGVCYLVLNIGPCALEDGYNVYSQCVAFSSIYAGMRFMQVLLYLYSGMCAQTTRIRLFCFWRVFTNGVITLCFILIAILADYTPAVMTLFCFNIVFDVSTFVLPNLYNGYVEALIPYDVPHMLERFNRILIINLGQNILASFAAVTFTTPPDGYVYLRATATLVIVISLRMLHFDVGNYDITRMKKNGHALRRGFVWGCFFVIAHLGLCMSVSAVGSTLQLYVSKGELSRYTFHGGIASALFFLCMLQLVHSHNKTPPAVRHHSFFVKFIQGILYQLGRKTVKILLKLIAICVLLPIVSIGPDDDADFVVVMYPCIILPVVVGLELLGYSRGVFFKK